MWVKAELHFASFFSYRIPGTSPSYTPASPVPSPVALRLALVDAAIQSSGSVDYGRDIFNLTQAGTPGGGATRLGNCSKRGCQKTKTCQTGKR